MDFIADNFNFDEEYSKIKSKVKKPNILLCGATGVGKSSVINKIFVKILLDLLMIKKMNHKI